MNNDFEKEIFIVKMPILRFFGWCQILSLLAFVCSLFMLIWCEWSITWKVGLTGIVGVIICYLIYEAIKLSLSKYYDECFKESTEKYKKEPNSSPKIKSAFEQKLDELREQKK